MDIGLQAFALKSRFPFPEGFSRRYVFFRKMNDKTDQLAGWLVRFVNVKRYFNLYSSPFPKGVPLPS